jgi:hypothetical protein
MQGPLSLYLPTWAMGVDLGSTIALDINSLQQRVKSYTLKNDMDLPYLSIHYGKWCTMPVINP